MESPSAHSPSQDCCNKPAVGTVPVAQQVPGDAPHAPAASCCHAATASAHVHAPVPARSLAPGEVLYVCPMCPGVESAVAGSCPKCGMALERAVPVAAAGDDPELLDMQRRFRWAVVFTVPLVVLAMGGMFGWLPRVLNGPASGWLQLALATPVVLWCGAPLLQRGWTSLRSRSFNMFTLIGLGVAVAYGFSTLAAMFPQVVPHAFRHGAATGLYFESAAMIVTLVLLGQVLELRARQQTGAALRALLDLVPRKAHRIEPDGTEAEVELTPGAGRRHAARAAGRKDSRWTAPCSKARARSTNPCLPANRSRSTRQSGAALIGGTVNGGGRLRHARRSRRRCDAAGADRADRGRRAAQPCAGAGTGRPRVGVVRAGRHRRRRRRCDRLDDRRARAATSRSRSSWRSAP